MNPNLENILNKSIQYKQQANKVLENSSVVGLLEEYGNVRIGGSYYTNLMLGADVDITVATGVDDNIAIAQEFLTKAVGLKIAQKYQLGDFKTFPRNNRPLSVIVVLQILHEGELWELEIWFFKHHRQEQIEYENSMITLPQEIKNKILMAKAIRNESTNKHDIDSFQIGQMALNGTIDEYINN